MSQVRGSAPELTDDAPDADTAKLLAKTVDGVRRDFEHFGFNTAVAKLIELNNAVTRLAAPPRAVVEPLVQMVAPLAPHIAEELWQRLGHEQTVSFEAFPDADPALLVDADEEHAIGAVASAVARTWVRTASPSEREHLLHRKPSIPPELDRALLVDLSTRLGAYEISEPVRFRLRTRFWEAAETAAHE